MTCLPFEILQEIFIHLPTLTLKRLNGSPQLTPELRAVVSSILYRHIYLGLRKSPDKFNVTVEDLVKVASGQVSCQIVSLSIELSHHTRLQIEAQKMSLELTAFCAKYPDFLPRIKEISFVGDEILYNACSLWTLDNVVNLSLSMQLSAANIFPANTRSLTLDLLTLSYSYKTWPEKLEELTLKNANTNNIKLPKSLKTLSCVSCQAVWKLYPKTLQTVQIYQGRKSDLELYPKSITKLDVSSVYITSLEFLSEYPKLKFLRLADCQISSLARVKFPIRLETLDLLGNRFASLNKIKFPPTLKKLILADCVTRRIDKRLLAKIEYLDISMLRVPSQLKSWTVSPWPKSLKVLKAIGQREIMWENCGFPPDLTRLEAAFKPTSKLRMPSFLQTLNINHHSFIDVTRLQIPRSVQTLQIVTPHALHGTGEWDLPNLKFFVLEDRFGSPRRVRLDLLDFLKVHTRPLEQGEFFFWEAALLPVQTLQALLGKDFVPKINLHIARRASQDMVTIPPIKVDTDVEILT